MRHLPQKAAPAHIRIPEANRKRPRALTACANTKIRPHSAGFPPMRRKGKRHLKIRRTMGFAKIWRTPSVRQNKTKSFLRKAATHKSAALSRADNSAKFAAGERSASSRHDEESAHPAAPPD